jgi:hypothetical protein
LEKLLLLLFLIPNLVMATPYSGGFYNDDYGGYGGRSNEGLGILFMYLLGIIAFIGLLYGLYIFIESFIKDRNFRKSILDKSKEEVVGFAKGLGSLPKDMACEVKTQSTLDQILFWAGVVLLFLIIISLTFGLV